MLRDTKSVLSWCFHPATTVRSAFNWAVVSSRRVFLSESSWQRQLANDVVTMIFSCAKKQLPDMPIRCFFAACPWSYVYLPLWSLWLWTFLFWKSWMMVVTVIFFQGDPWRFWPSQSCQHWSSAPPRSSSNPSAPSAAWTSSYLRIHCLHFQHLSATGSIL